MKADIKKKWVSALRSGRYRQGHGFLARGGNFCCLGVLCELAKEDGVNIHIATHDEDSYITYDGQFELLPDSVVEWAGLNGPSPRVNVINKDVYHEDDVDDPNDVTSLSLAELNDDFGKTFYDIATLIEDTPIEYAL